MIYAAIDPSVNNIGVAVHNTETQMVDTHLYRPVRTDSLLFDARTVLQKIKTSILLNRPVDYLTIEYPNWQNSDKGLIAMQQGYTLDLAFQVGIFAAGFGLPSGSVFLPTPNIWKGNTPKLATEHRVQKKFGILQISEHEYDALGMILWTIKQTAPSRLPA